MEKNCFEKLVKRISVETLDWFEAGFHKLKDKNKQRI